MARHQPARCRLSARHCKLNRRRSLTACLSPMSHNRHKASWAGFVAADRTTRSAPAGRKSQTAAQKRKTADLSARRSNFALAAKDYSAEASAGAAAAAAMAAAASSCAFFRAASALLGLLARLALVRVGAGVALGKAGDVEEAGNAVGRQRAVGQPMLDAVGVDLDAVAVLGQQRVPGADRLDEAAVARASGRRRRRCGSRGASWSRRGPDGFSGTLSYSWMVLSWVWYVSVCPPSGGGSPV